LIDFEAESAKTGGRNKVASLLRIALSTGKPEGVFRNGIWELERELLAYLFLFDSVQWIALHRELRAHYRKAELESLQNHRTTEWVKWFKMSYPRQASHFDRVIFNKDDPYRETD
jgi:hypothetical protein